MRSWGTGSAKSAGNDELASLCSAGGGKQRVKEMIYI